MKKQLKIVVDGEAFYAGLCVDEAPDAVAALEAAGPFETVLFSADVCYGEMTFTTPVDDYWLEENVQPETKPGDVTFYDEWSAVCLFTREMEQFGPGAKVAQIAPEDLPRFQRLYDEIWHHPGRRVSVAVVERDDATGEERPCGAPAQEGAADAAGEVGPAVSRLQSYLREIWLDRPAELDGMRLRNASTARELGVWAYAWGELVNLSDMLLCLMGMARRGEGDVATLGAVAAEQCRFFATIFESSAHMPRTKAILEEVADDYGTVTDRTGFLALTRAAQRWILQMCLWCDMELPWDRMSATLHEAWNPGA